ncbi:MAG: low-specificity L-threonine aldolase [Myxococcota bacterium]|nr:low-specificity L-threonine aldolase [Myxococcota bacterium]
MRPVDLRSDTVTRPTKGMLQAMFEAEVGDDVFQADPTVNALEARSAELSGMEAALFTPSGTMANQIAIRCWTQPGDEVLMEAGAHPYNYEAGAAAAISGVQVRTIPGDRGLMEPEDVFACVRVDDPHFAPATLVCLENTSNRGGGTPYPQAILDTIAEGARTRGLRVHLDGARVFNAAVATGSRLDRIVRDFDSVAFCLSKGLGAPVGSLLCGPADFIHKARRMRKMLGGGMRQAGYLAAAGLYALEHHIARLSEDHRRAKRLADGLRDLGLHAPEPATNMVYFDIPGAQQAAEAVAERGIQLLAVGPNTIRAVTHLDVDDEGIEAAIAAFAAL